jgi:hypothetical protein
MLLKQTPKVATNARRKLLRVSASLRNADPPAYIPNFVSLGPNHFRKPETDSQCDDLMMISTNEGYKVKSAAILWHKLMNIQTKRLSLDDMVNDIEEMRPHIESFYDWSNTDNDYRNDLGLMMAVDCFFILQFLFGHDRRAHGIQIKCDILKLENQIPLSVLKLVFDKVKKALLHPHLYHDIYYKEACRINRLLVLKAYKELCPFDITPDDIQSDEPHLLACIHAIVLQFLQIQQDLQDEREPHLLGCVPKPSRPQKISNFLQVRVLEKMCRIFVNFFSAYKPGDFPIKGYTAEELAKAGIKFKSFSKPSEYIWFDKYSQKLYLPRMTVTSPTQTEVFFKNLLAFEFNDDDAGSHHVRHFVQLMDALIDTSQDVRRLRKAHVICLRSALSDKDLAKIWDSMHKPFSTGHLEPPEELKQALDDVLIAHCCTIKCKIWLSEHFVGVINFCFSKVGLASLN